MSVLCAVIATAVMIAGTGCAAPTPILKADDTPMRNVRTGQATALAAVVAATREAGVHLIAAGDPAANVVVSPSSLVVALSMLADGAAGQTLTELEMAVGAAGSERLDAMAALRGVLTPLDGNPGTAVKELPDQPLVHLATQVVVDDQFTANPDYLRALAEGYGTGVLSVDLGSASGMRQLDAWVKEHSGGLVTESALEPSDIARLALQDAITLAARWESPFNAAFTRSGPFTLATGSPVSVDTMRQWVWGAFAEVDGWRAFRLPYNGGDLSAQFILPPDGIDPGEMTADMAGRISAALVSSTQDVQVDLSVPQMNLRPEPLDILPALRGLGVDVVLDAARADLSRTGTSDDGENTYLGQGVQQAVLMVDEEGTRAAAVTEMLAEAGAAPEEPDVTLHLDRPFAMIIEHEVTGWPLFHAVIRDPRG
ncbi:MAG: serpin family protein [Cellulomonadaceae bacterium]|nr:serpin family protein [Cellulomonadaceae bacterium]